MDLHHLSSVTRYIPILATRTQRAPPAAQSPPEPATDNPPITAAPARGPTKGHSRAAHSHTRPRPPTRPSPLVHASLARFQQNPRRDRPAKPRAPKLPPTRRSSSAGLSTREQGRGHPLGCLRALSDTLVAFFTGAHVNARGCLPCPTPLRHRFDRKLQASGERAPTGEA